jgi:hypothetical protein
MLIFRNFIQFFNNFGLFDSERSAQSRAKKSALEPQAKFPVCSLQGFTTKIAHNLSIRIFLLEKHMAIFFG